MCESVTSVVCAWPARGAQHFVWSHCVYISDLCTGLWMAHAAATAMPWHWVPCGVLDLVSVDRIGASDNEGPCAIGTCESTCVY